MDHEGTNGLPYRSSGDPRTPVTQLDNGRYHPDKYHIDGTDTIVLASGVEARLIGAEAALRDSPNGGAWLDELNALRTDSTQSPAGTVADTLGVTGCGPEPEFRCAEDGLTGGHFQLPPGATLTSSFEITVAGELQQYCIDNSFYGPCSESPGGATVHVYSVPAQWRAGTGGVAGLAPLTDPGADADRVSLLFRERAFWLFLTGHRQGDMRRLVRQYRRPQSEVYPVGAGMEGGTYGQHIDAPVPWQERELNPLFTGCLSRD